MLPKKKNAKNHLGAKADANMDTKKQLRDFPPSKKKPQSGPKITSAKKPYDFRKLSVQINRKKKQKSKSNLPSTAVTSDREARGKKDITSEFETSIAFTSDAVNNKVRDQTKDLTEVSRQEIHTMNLEMQRLRDRVAYLQQQQSVFDQVKAAMEAEKQKLNAMVNKVVEENRHLSSENHDLKEQLVEKDRYAEKLIRKVHELEIYSRKLSEDIKVLNDTNQKIIKQLHYLEDQKRTFNKTFENSNEELRRMMREKAILDRKVAECERDRGTLRGSMKLKTSETDRCTADIKRNKLLIEELRNENRDLKERVNAKEHATREDLGMM